MPFSERNSNTCPHLAMNPLRVFTKDWVSKDDAASRCIALTARHVKMTLYLFTVPLPCLSSKGPKQSTPTRVNGGSSGKTPSWGRFAIRWCPRAAYNLWQIIHLEKVFLIATLDQESNIFGVALKAYGYVHHDPSDNVYDGEWGNVKILGQYSRMSCLIWHSCSTKPASNSNPFANWIAHLETTSFDKSRQL